MDIKSIHRIPILSLDGMVTLIEHLALHQGHIILEIGLLFFFGDNTLILNHTVSSTKHC